MKKKKKIALILIFILIVLAFIFLFTYYNLNTNKNRGINKKTNHALSISQVKPTKTYSSALNQNLYEYEKNQFNETLSINKAILARGGTALNTCVLFQCESLRAIGVNVPMKTTFTTNLSYYLQNNGWKKETNLDNLQSGDLCFAGDKHTFLFMGWKDKINKIAYVMGDESYMFPKTYISRNLNGQVATKANNYNAQFKTTYYLKYTGNNKGTSASLSATEANILKNSLGRVSVKSPSGLWMTSKLNNSSTKLVCLDSNLILYVLASENGFYKVYYDNMIGYVPAKYTTGLGNPLSTSANNIEVVTAKKANS